MEGGHAQPIPWLGGGGSDRLSQKKLEVPPFHGYSPARRMYAGFSESSGVGACEDPAAESSGHAAAGDVERCDGGAEPCAAALCRVRGCGRG